MSELKIRMSDVFESKLTHYNCFLIEEDNDPDDMVVIANFDQDYTNHISKKKK